MYKIPAAITAAAVACAIATSARADSSDDLKEVRAQIQQLKRDYETRIRALEKRLAAAEAKAARAERTAGEVRQQALETRQTVAAASQPMTAPEAAAPAPTQQERQNAFNPAISLIMEGTYANFSQDPDDYHISGFMTPPETGPGQRGLSIAETELAISQWHSDIPHKWYFSPRRVTA